jgi:hypothetical protein
MFLSLTRCMVYVRNIILQLERNTRFGHGKSNIEMSRNLLLNDLPKLLKDKYACVKVVKFFLFQYLYFVGSGFYSTFRVISVYCSTGESCKSSASLEFFILVACLLTR